MPTLNPQPLNEEEYAMLKDVKERLRARSWKELWILLAQHYDGSDGHTLTKEKAAKLIKDLELEKSTEKEVIDTSEMEKFEARLKALETKEGEPEPEPKRMTKEDIIKHLETCTDPNCEYRMIAQAIRELERMKEPDLSKGFLKIGEKTFTLNQILEAKKYCEETNTPWILHKGHYVSEPFRRSIMGSFEEDFNYRLENALQDAKEFEKEEKYRLEEAQKEAKELEAAQKK